MQQYASATSRIETTNIDDQLATLGTPGTEATGFGGENTRGYASNTQPKIDFRSKAISGDTLSRGTVDGTMNDEPDPFGGAGTHLKDLLKRDT